MPHFVFISLALIAGVSAYIINHLRNNQQAPELAGGPGSGKAGELTAKTSDDEAEQELGWSDVAPVDMVGLEVGYRLFRW